jgi:multicomponent Na+:H+ antiporter subunit C
MGIAIYMLAFAFLLLGIYALVAKKNVVRMIIGIAILEYAVNLILVLTGYRTNGLAPILGRNIDPGQLAARAVDPLPQAVVLTTIVVELATTILAVALAIRLYDKYGTFDMNDIRKLRG